MHITRMLLAAALILTGTGAAQASTQQAPNAELAKAVEGRTAGAPVSCIMLNQIRSSRIISRTAIVYEMSNGKLYVNQPTSGAQSLRRDLALVTDTRSPQLCSVDIVRLFDSAARMTVGTIGLGEFVPYARPAPAN